MAEIEAYDMDDLHWMWVESLGQWAPTPALLVAESKGRPAQPMPCECARPRLYSPPDDHKSGIYGESNCWACDGTGIRPPPENADKEGASRG